MSNIKTADKESLAVKLKHGYLNWTGILHHLHSPCEREPPAPCWPPSCSRLGTKEQKYKIFIGLKIQPIYAK